jgi:hypothetical protein
MQRRSEPDRRLPQIEPRRFAQSKKAVSILSDFAKSSRPHVAKLAKQLLKSPGTDLKAVTITCISKLGGKALKSRLVALDQLEVLTAIYSAKSEFDELIKLLPSIFDCLSDENDVVRVHTLGLLRYFGGKNNSIDIVRAVTAKVLLPTVSAEVIQAATDLMVALGVDVAAIAVPSLIGLLGHDDQAVGREICWVLGWLGGEAATVSNALIETATKSPSPDMQLAAIEALEKIDPNNEWLSSVTVDKNANDRLTEHLRRKGSTGRRLRLLLQSSVGSALIVPRGRTSKWDDLYQLHDRLRAEDPDNTDTKIINRYRQLFKGDKQKKGEWEDPSVRVLQNYRTRLRQKQKSPATATTH